MELDSQFMTALAAPAVDDRPARGRVHALQKAMSLASDHFVPFALHGEYV